MRLPLTIASLLLATSDCTYTVARLDYEMHAELRAVRYWTSKQNSKVPTIGPVEAAEGGWLDCDAMATSATRYENPFHMAGRPRCRRNWVLLGHMTVRASGLAVREEPVAEEQGP